MDVESQEIVQCREVFAKKPLWSFFTTDNTAQKLRCLEIFKEKGKPQDISIFFESLTNSNESLRNSAAETIAVLLEKLDSQAQFYSILRYLSFEQNDYDFYKRTFSNDFYLQILILASLNSSGYVREKAVNELSAMQKPEAIKFIIFRLGDWVENVRDAALKALTAYFQPVFVDDFLKQLPLFERLLKVERTDLSEIYSDIYRFILSFDLDETFYQKLNHLNEKAKFIYVRHYLNLKPLTAEIFQRLSKDNLFLVRIELLKHIEKLDEETQKSFAGKFLKDRSAKVRVYALYSIRKPFKAEFYDALIHSAFDVSAPVRETARLILRDFTIDFPDLYRERLKEDENSLGAILGLSEVRTTQDLAIFESCIRKPNAKIQAASLSAISYLDKNLAKIYALELLDHSSAKVRNKCVEILFPIADEEILETARTVYRQGDYERKKTILKMFGKIGGWKIVGEFIIALSDQNENIRKLAWLNLVKWRSIQRYTIPSPEDKTHILKLYTEFDRTKLILDNFSEKFWNELPFYLR